MGKQGGTECRERSEKLLASEFEDVNNTNSNVIIHHLDEDIIILINLYRPP